MRPVPPELNTLRSGHVLIIGRDVAECDNEPQTDELTGARYPQGRPLTGRAGDELGRVLSATGLRRQDVNIALTVPFYLPGSSDRTWAKDFKRHAEAEVRYGLDALKTLVKQLKPSLIICMGNEASYALLSDSWPTSGRGIQGAKSIEDRRGYFWPSEYGWVLTCLHPMQVLAKVVPGQYLLETDFKRARKWLEKRLPREEVPEPKPLTPSAAKYLSGHKLLAWDIESKWNMNALFCSGFCGDDLQPYIGKYPRDAGAIWSLLTHRVPKCGHNGIFDLSLMKHVYGLDVAGYTDDTQHMWWALEPELAGQDESEESQGRTRMTRKALAFLTTVYDLNLPYWKIYPSGPQDPEHDSKLWRVNYHDIYATKVLATSMLAEIRQANVGAQYRRSVEMIPFTVEQHLRGLRVDEELIQGSVQALAIREELKKSEAADHALKYIRDKEIEFFQDTRKCECCGGGKKQAQQCWRCTGLPSDPKPLKKKEFYDALALTGLGVTDKMKRSDAEALMQTCRTCNGTQKLISYSFNPFSVQQLSRLLYEELGTPKGYQKGKVVSDEAQLKKILRWTNQGGGKDG